MRKILSFCTLVIFIGASFALASDKCKDPAKDAALAQLNTDFPNQSYARVTYVGKLSKADPNTYKVLIRISEENYEVYNVSITTDGQVCTASNPRFVNTMVVDEVGACWSGNPGSQICFPAAQKDCVATWNRGRCPNF